MVKSVKSTHNTNSMGSRAKCHQLVYDSQKHPATSDVGGIPTSEIPWLVAWWIGTAAYKLTREKREKGRVY